MCSLPGIRKIFEATNVVSRTIWITLIVVLITSFCIQIAVLANNYFSHPTRTSYESIFQSKQIFPAITICNLNSMKYSFLKKFIIEYSQTKRGQTNLANSNYNTKNDTWILLKEEAKKENMTLSQYMRLMVTNIALKLKRNITAAGFTLSDMLKDCTWSDNSCIGGNLENEFWSSFWHWKYGNCYTFNSGSSNGSHVLSTDFPGPDQGLTLTFNLNNSEKVPFESNIKAGIRIFIGDQRVQPSLVNQGFNLAPGYSYDLKLKKIQSLRVKNCHRQLCASSFAKDTSNCKNEIGNRKGAEYMYSIDRCTTDCIKKRQIEDCQCSFLGYHDLTSLDYNATKDRICLNTTERLCMSKIYKAEKYPEACIRSCKPPCQEVHYEYEKDFCQYHNQEVLKFGQQTAKTNNVLKVSIYYKSFNVDVIKEEEYFHLVNFLTDIGGQFGLSVLIIVSLEILTSAFQCFRPKQSKKTKVIKRTDDPVEVYIRALNYDHQ